MQQFYWENVENIDRGRLQVDTVTELQSGTVSLSSEQLSAFPQMQEFCKVEVTHR